MKPSRLEELRDILLRPDQEKLEELRARVEEANLRAADVAEVLPDSVTTSFQRDSRLIQALRTPLRQCVSESVREDPDEYADALFPIMGPAIRRSVAEALKAWIQQANLALEQTLSPRHLAWRFEAWRAGVSYGEYVLQKTLVYQVEEVYLIHSETGLLIGHVSDSEERLKDEDAVSAMFTAIQDFARDSFSREQSDELTTAELGELTLWAVHGPTATMVAVIRGAPPVTLRAELERALELIETRHSPALREYSGDRASMAHLEPDLRSCLLASADLVSPRERDRRVSPALLLAALIALAAVLWLGYGFWLNARVASVADALDATPGIVVTRLERDGGSIVVRGLRDPLAPPPADIVVAAGWTGELRGEFTPFLSLDDELVLARLRAALDPPDTVTMQVVSGTLTLQGSATAAWISAMESSAGNVPGVVDVDAAALAVSDLITLEQLREILGPPETVTLTLENAVLGIVGEAPKSWLDAVPAADELRGVDAIDDSRLVLSEQRALDAIASEINATALSFDPGEVALPERESGNLARLAGELGRYAAVAERLGLEPRLTITGHSDDSGTNALNIDFEQQRAENLAAELRAAGVDVARIVTRSQLETQAPGDRTPQVTFRLETVASSTPAARD